VFDEVQAKIRAKYGRWQIRIIPWISRLQGRLKAGQTFGDTVVLITVAENSARPRDGRPDAWLQRTEARNPTRSGFPPTTPLN